MSARRVDAHGSLARCKDAQIVLGMASIDYEILVDTDEDDRRIALLRDNVRKYGTVFNTVAPGTSLSGTMRRAE